MRLQTFLLQVMFFAATACAFTSTAQQPGTLQVKDFEKGIKQLNIQLLDVRTAGGY
jgi:hypothetical protein